MLSWFGIKSQGSEASNKQETSNETSDVSSSQTEVEALKEEPKAENVSDSPSGPNSGSSEGNAVPVGIAGAFGFLRNIATAAGKTAYKLKESVDETLDKTIIGDLERENQKFVREKHTKRTEDPVPPWVGYNEEEDMKTQILALSADERHFLRDPPSGVDFHFELDAVMPIALTILQEDKQLQAMRFKLVPQKVKEERFWRNYFYRVSLIKQSSQLSTLATSEFKRSSSSLNQEGKRNSKSDLEKAASDEAANDDISKTQTQSKTEESRLNSEGSSERADGSTSAKGDQLSHDWEKELQDELQDFEFVSEDQGDNHESNPEWEKEIENMLGLDEEEDLESKTN